MKNFLKTIIALTLGLSMLAAASVYTMPSTDKARNRAEYAPSDYLFEGSYKMPRNSLDVVFLGSSEIYNAISPMEMWREQGIAGYCCSSSGQQAVTSYYYLREILRRQSPKLAVVDVYGLYTDPAQVSRNEGNNRSATDKMRFSREKIALSRILWKQQKDKGESFWSYLLPVLRFHSRWTELKETDLTLRQHYDYARGYSTVFGDTAYAGLTEESYPFLSQEPTDEAAERDEEAAGWYRKIGELCARRGIRLLMIRTPCSGYTLEDKNALYRLAAECGADALDFNDAAVWAQMDFDCTNDMLDSVHLNYRGAKKLSVYLGGVLRRDYGLPDHRGEEAYAFWDSDLPLYDAELRAWKIQHCTTGTKLRKLVMDENYELLAVGAENAEPAFAAALGVDPGIPSLWISRWDGAQVSTEYTEESRGFFGAEEYEINDTGIYMHGCNYMVGSGGLYYVVRDRLLGKIVDYGTVEPTGKIRRS
ncbi:MAG: hypothetical protein K6F56_05685 [Oscillospiraceae bacterium]|nr:hypothetical protein [Oscillospiraceae bacterium]